jgi:Ca2+-dependent lipid-binding protein
VLRIHLAEASNLIAKDNFIGGMVKGKSDPYVKIRVAGVTFRSHTIKENLNPSWNELYEVEYRAVLDIHSIFSTCCLRTLQIYALIL